MKHWTRFVIAIAVAATAAFLAAAAFMRYVSPSLGHFLATSPSEPIRVAITLLFAATILALGLIFIGAALATMAFMNLQTRLAQRDIVHARAEMIAIWGPAVDEAFEKAQKAQ